MDEMSMGEYNNDYDDNSFDEFDYSNDGKSSKM